MGSSGSGGADGAAGAGAAWLGALVLSAALLVTVTLVAVAICCLKKFLRVRSRETPEISIKNPTYDKDVPGNTAGGPTPMRPDIVPIGIAIENVPRLDRSALTLQEEVGRGNFGKVHKGLLRTADGEQHVAIKLLKEGADSDTEEKFLGEVYIMSEFRHPNILSLLGIVHRDDTGASPWMVFEFMAWGDLAGVLRDPRGGGREGLALDAPALLRVALQVARGMQYLASQRFVHRDLAARNCLVTDHLKVKIADFGMSRDIYTRDYYKMETEKAMPVRWMSPESIEYGRFTHESDVWSYGVLLWEIYSGGREPYCGRTNAEAVKKIIEGIGVPLPSPQDCPRFAYKLMCKCWKKEPQERISFDEICRKLEAEDTKSVPRLDRSALTLQEEVGQGNYGQVFKGLLRTADGEQYVAIKLLKEGADSNTEQEFLREVSIMSEFRHPNILSLLGIVHRDDTGASPWMVFEFMARGDLAGVLRDPRGGGREDLALDAPALLHVALQVARGMQYLASQRFVHRDLAARNCLVGDNLTVKVADFGMSRDIYKCDYYKMGRGKAMPVRWMSPESIEYGRFTHESDVWSYGVLLWEIYSGGKQPYYGRSNAEAKDIIIEVKGVPLPSPQDCPKFAYKLMCECWKKEPRERISFDEICRKLEAEATKSIPRLDRSALTLQEEVGQGNFGQVFKGLLRTADCEQHVAIKLLKEGADSDTEEEFLREVSIMSEFRHPNILSLLGIVHRDDTGASPWMVFEFMARGDLAGVLRDPRGGGREDLALDAPALLHVALQVARGMQYLASQRFVHRDLAARNCLVGDNLTVKVADFGMSRDIYIRDYYKMGPGKPVPVRWMSPESIAYSRFSHESDVWSYGVLLWEIYSGGKQPYYGHSDLDAVNIIEQGVKLVPPSGCPGFACELMRKCWVSDPRERISFDEICGRLEAARGLDAAPHSDS